jgi:hypothetical protein
MSRTVCTIAGVDVIEHDDGSVSWLAGMQIDSDGAPGNPGNDPCWQSDTTLHHNGDAINSNTVPFIVVPPAIIQGVKGIVLGCQADAHHIETGKGTSAVVADVGPHKKIGEASMECARRCGVNESPTRGGTDRKFILYTIWPGKPAQVDGITYNLKSGTNIK